MSGRARRRSRKRTHRSFMLGIDSVACVCARACVLHSQAAARVRVFVRKHGLALALCENVSVGACARVSTRARPCVPAPTRGVPVIL
eukprot:3875315-Pleurochrysis_carterae.AAC.1